MKNNQNPQSNQNAFPAQSNASKTKKIHAEVWQDKARFSRARIASHQPAPVKNSLRAHAMNRNAPRSQNYTKGRRKSVKVTTWVKPIVKSELERISVQEGISVSAAAAAFLEKSLQQHIDLQYSALLTPIIEQAIAKEMRAISTRLAWLLVKVAYGGGQTRSLVTNILGRQPGMTPEILTKIWR